MSSDVVIDVDGLHVRYPTAEEDWALRGVDLKVRRGEFVGIVGPSGAGKTTLCMTIKGLIPHSQSGDVDGDVTVLGRNVVDEVPGELAARVGMVFQDPEGQIVGLTVAEELAYGPENFMVDPSEIRARSPQMLEQMGLAGLLDRDTVELSGGQKQRLAIASVLMLDPEVLILDEPTSELDPVGKSDVFKIVDRLRQESQVTIVMVEHDIERLAGMADRIVVMEQGRIATEGRTAELLADVDIFMRTGGERPVAAAELTWRLQQRGLLEPGQVTIDETRAIGVVSDLLASHR